MINSSNQKLIHQNHCFEYIFCHQKQGKKNLVDVICSYSIVFRLNFIHWVSYTFFIQEYIFMFIMIYYCYNIFIHVFCFFMFIIVYQKWIYLGLQYNKFYNCSTSGFIFHYSNDLLAWFIIVYWLSRIITGIKHFFIAIKIFRGIFSFIQFYTLYYQHLWIIVLICCNIYFHSNRNVIRTLIIYSILKYAFQRAQAC